MTAIMTIFFLVGYCSLCPNTVLKNLLQFLYIFLMLHRKTALVTIPFQNINASNYLPCFIITVRKRIITFELGLIRTWRLPRFSAFPILLKASARTFMRTIMVNYAESVRTLHKVIYFIGNMNNKNGNSSMGMNFLKSNVALFIRISIAGSYSIKSLCY